MILRFLIGLLFAGFGVAIATIHELDAAHSGPKNYSVTVTTSGGGTGIMLPLTGGVLAANSGTITFDNSQGPYGFNVMENKGSGPKSMGLQATSLKVVSGLLIAKYDTAMPAGAPQTACLQETTTISDAGQIHPNPMILFAPITCPADMP